VHSGRLRMKDRSSKPHSPQTQLQPLLMPLRSFAFAFQLTAAAPSYLSWQRASYYGSDEIAPTISCAVPLSCHHSAPRTPQQQHRHLSHLQCRVAQYKSECKYVYNTCRMEFSGDKPASFASAAASSRKLSSPSPLVSSRSNSSSTAPSAMRNLPMPPERSTCVACARLLLEWRELF